MISKELFRQSRLKWEDRSQAILVYVFLQTKI